MKTTMDAAGRLVLPKPIRDGADLRPGEPLEVTLRDGLIEIEPAPREVRIRQCQGFLVAEPVGPAETLREKAVRKTRGLTRERRKPR
jgi:AbrB family looped-hinge helix DNA binding protein